MADTPTMAALEMKEEKLANGRFAEEERSGISFDSAAEKRLVRKLDRHIIPIVMLLYLLSFLDR